MMTDVCSMKLLSHPTSMISAFNKLREDDTLLDVTLACEGKSLKAHKLVLSACSQFFNNLFNENPCKHPIVFLKDVRYNDLKALIDFMYKGELSVPRARLDSTLKVAAELFINGLVDSVVEDLNESNSGKEQMSQPLKRKKQKNKHRSAMKSVARAELSQIIKEEIKNSHSSDEGLNESNIEKDDMIPKDAASESELVKSKDFRPFIMCVSTSQHTDSTQPLNDSVGELSSNPGETFLMNSDVENFFDDNSNEVKALIAREQSLVPSASDDSSASLDFSKCRETDENSTMDSYILPTNDHNNRDVQSQGQMQSSTDSHSLNVQTTVASSSSNTFSSKKTFKSKPKHRASIIGFECSLCGRVFTSHVALTRHEVIIHKTTDTVLPYKCLHCPYTARRPGRIIDHLSTHTSERPYKCSVCQKGFKMWAQLRQHLEVHTQEQQYACESCPSKFKRKSSLTIHRRVHLKEKHFMCRHCCKTFTRGSDTLKHEKTCQGVLKPSRFKILNVQNLTKL